MIREEKNSRKDKKRKERKSRNKNLNDIQPFAKVSFGIDSNSKRLNHIN
jgi:hypothetical protein